MAIIKSTISPKAKMLPPGVYTPVISLYKPTKTQELDLDAMYKHCQYLVRGGMHGLVYQGNNPTALLCYYNPELPQVQTAKQYSSPEKRE
jgi:4-hydroxy-2-oxoglutarate aldolase